MIVENGQEYCIDGRWYRGGDTLPVFAEAQIVDNNDVKNTETVDEPQKKRGK